MNIRAILLTGIVAASLGGIFSLTPAIAEEPYTKPVVNCESWQAPGWLNDQGDPTGCVDNASCPEAREGLPCPADVVYVEPEVVPDQPRVVEVPATPVLPDAIPVPVVSAPLLRTGDC